MTEKQFNVDWKTRSHQVLAGARITREEALQILQSHDNDLLAILDAAFQIRLHYFQRNVRLHVICNARNGGCTEDCVYCSQTNSPTSTVPSPETVIAGAHTAHRMKAARYCIVSSGRTPSDEDINRIVAITRAIKAELPIQVCLSFGLLSFDQAKELKQAGVDRYNHNLETSERFFPNICTTHAYADRAATAKAVKAAGLDLCCGGLVGLGETLEDRVDLAFALNELHADSIPVNFLNPRPGTRYEGHPLMQPTDCLRTLAMFRFVNPARELRAAGGREAVLGPLQALSLFPANSIFTNGYLTTSGQGYQADLAMINSAGFIIDEIVHA